MEYALKLLSLSVEMTFGYLTFLSKFFLKFQATQTEKSQVQNKQDSFFIGIPVTTNLMANT